MSHVDEGALHAYLDGALNEYPQEEAEDIRAHLTECGACAQRLETERRIRADAQAMLSLAAPRVDAPDFEELRAYVKRTRAPRASGLSRIQRLGWAASVVLALGVGWMLRETELIGTAGQRQEALAPLPAAEVGSEAAPSRSADRSGAARGGPAADGVPTVDVAPEARSTVARPAVSDVVSSVTQEDALGRAAEAPDESLASSPSTEGEVSAFAVRDDAAATEGRRVIEEAGETQAVVASPETAQVVVAPAQAPVSARAAAPEPVRSTTFDATVEAAREEAILAPDDSTAGGAPLGLPGYEVVSVTNLGSGDAPWGRSVLQRLPDGEMLAFIQLEAGVDPSVLPETAQDQNEILLETSDGWVVLRAPLPPEELSRLARQIHPRTP